MSTRKAHLELLGLADGATRGEIRQAFLALAKRCHPDRGAAPDATPDSERFRRIQQAYAAL
eukprot:6808520-Prymnesium_polylepis.1